MILARNSITLHHLRDITTVVWYYKLQASTASPPAKPTTATPSGWTTTEPSYTEGSTNSLYVVQKTTFSDGTFEYSDVSLSTSYEAAKAAYNKSVQAQTTANAAQESIDNLEIGGRNLLLNSATNFPAKYGSSTLTTQNNVAIPEFKCTDGLRCYGKTGTSNNLCLLINNVSHGLSVSSATSVRDQQYVLSIYIKNNHGTNPFFVNSDIPSISGTQSIQPGEAKRVVFYATGNNYHVIQIVLKTNAAEDDYDITFWHPQIELGNKVTDWSPAPEDMQAGIDTLQPELIVGTHGTTATATWTGTSTVLTEIKAGTRIQYKLSSAGASNVTLNLTLKNGTTTGAKNVYFLNTTRLGTQYDVNAIVDLIYDGSAWRVLNPYTNSNTVGTYGGAVKAGANGVKNYSLVMRDTETTWVSLTTTAGTGTTKSRYTGKLYPDNVMYMGSNSAYASEATTGTCYEALGVNLQYSTNCGSTLVSGRAVYLVGTLDSDGLFTLDATWWTQTIPTTADGKTYIYLGLAYSTTSIYLVPENTLYQYFEGAFRTLREIEEMKAAKVADNYLSADNTGIMVADMTDGTQYTPSNVPSGTKNTFINEDSFQVRDGTDVLASFGETTQIGQDGTNHQVIDGNGISGVNVDGMTVFNVGMNGGSIPYSGKETIWYEQDYSDYDINESNPSDRWTYSETKAHNSFLYNCIRFTDKYEFVLTYNDATTESEWISGSFVNDKTIDHQHRNKINITKAYASLTLECWYQQNEIRHGYEIQYIKDTSLSRYVTNIHIKGPLVEYSGYTPAPAYSLGTRMNDRVTEIGGFSGICGEFLSAKTRDQFACGRFNRDESDYAFMVGNGSMEDGDSNALAVTWDGNQLMALDEDAITGTDAELYAAITAHGWESEVIV